MDALDVLEQQHRDVSEMLARVAAEASPGSRTALVTRLVRVVDAHSRCEERLLYPLLAERMRASGSERLQLDEERYYRACEEHAMTRMVARMLLQTRVTDVRFDARLELLRRTFTSHVDAEEDWLFQRAKRDLTDEQLDAIGEDLLRTFDLLMHASEPRRLRTAPRRTPRRRARARVRLAA